MPSPIPDRLWLVLYAVQAVFWFWLTRFRSSDVTGGRRWLWLLNPIAWTASGAALRLIGWVGLLASTLWFAVGWFFPGAREVWRRL